MELAPLGELLIDQQLNECVSRPISVPCLGGKSYRFILSNLRGDSTPDDFTAAIGNLVSLDSSVLSAAAPHAFLYYEDIRDVVDDSEIPRIQNSDSIWEHVIFGDDLVVERRRHKDRGVYISLECECSWEPEHGLQVVFRNGKIISKIGPYDGHLTNSDAYARDEFESIIYVTSDML